MRRFRTWRRRTAALALAPVAATMTIAMLASIGPAAAAGGGTRLDASHHQVKANKRVTLRGRFVAPAAKPDQAGGSSKPAKPSGPSDETQPVRIQFRALGAKSWQDARRTKTGRGGRFSERVEVERSGRFRALSSDGRATPAQKVRVKSRTRARVSEKSPTVGETVAIRGNVVPAGSRRPIAVRIGGDTVRTRTSANGRFKAQWKATTAGASKVSVRARSNRIAAGSRDNAGEVTAFRPAVASYYGPGLYGNHLGCGGTLQPSTVGVANKSLPCGTKLTVRYGNTEVETEVIDRGPYVGGREFDLTVALKSKLGFGSTGTVLVSR